MIPTGEVNKSDGSDDDGSGAPEGLRAYLYLIALVSAATLIGAATVFYRLVEDWTWVDAFYFSSVAVTTVGFGDLTPTTDAAKLFTVFYIFMGISLVSVVLNEWLRRQSERRSAWFRKHHGGQ